MRTQRKGAICKPGNGPSPNPTTLASWPLTSSLQNRGKHVFPHIVDSPLPVYGVLLEQPELSKTDELSHGVGSLKVYFEISAELFPLLLRGSYKGQIRGRIQFFLVFFFFFPDILTLLIWTTLLFTGLITKAQSLLGPAPWGPSCALLTSIHTALVTVFLSQKSINGCSANGFCSSFFLRLQLSLRK